MADASPSASSAVVPNFIRVAACEQLERDGLTVLGAGLGAPTLVAQLLSIHMRGQKGGASAPTAPADARGGAGGGVVVVLGSTGEFRNAVASELRRMQGTQSASDPGSHQQDPNALPYDVSADMPSAERARLYNLPFAVLYITTRIFVVDLLTGRAPADRIAGVMVVNAHQVNENSGEGFAVRLYRARNAHGFVRACTDAPHVLSSGFHSVERRLKALHVRRLYLWPRFQMQVSSELEARGPEVIELRQPLSPAMVAIQAAIVQVLEDCLKELGKTRRNGGTAPGSVQAGVPNNNNATYFDRSDLTLENNLFKSFDEVLRRQLDPVWHTLNRKTRKLVYDLRTLRQLSTFLIRYDAVTFLRYLEALRVGEGVNSVWMYAAAARTIFVRARARVYEVRASGEAQAAAADEGTEGVVACDGGGSGGKRRRQHGPDGTGAPASAPAAPPRHRRDTAAKRGRGGRQAAPSSSSARAAHADAPEHLSGSELVPVLEELPKWGLLKDVVAEIEGMRAPRQVSPSSRVTTGDGGQDEAILIVARDEAACSQLRAILRFGPRIVMEDTFETFLANRGDLRRMRHSRPAQARRAAAAGVAVDVRRGARNVAENDDEEEGTGGAEGNGEEGTEGDGGEGPLRHVHVLPLEAANSTAMYSIRPGFVILYDPDPRTIREIEVYNAVSRPAGENRNAAISCSRRMRVYFLAYEKSLEEHKFLASLKRERQAFEGLIREKAHMSHREPEEEPRRVAGGAISPVPVGSNTLIAGGRSIVRARPHRLVVDMREFMSTLPAVLHQQGMDITPITLEVGDYILSPTMCVERKSVSDLHGSFLSGRLFNQAEAMVKGYNSPVLLIEFEAGKAFSLLSKGEMPHDISPSCIISKLCLLTIHFPRLRMIWSRSPHATADIFMALKSNQEEPVAEDAACVGTDDESCRSEDVVNDAALEVLRRLPGVTAANMWTILGRCEKVADLCGFSMEDLVGLLGSRKNAAQLFEFLHAKTPTMAAAV